MLNEGYRNIQLTDVCARTVEPEAHRLARQVYLWSSSFFQSCYYFDPLLRSPFKAFKRWRSEPGHRAPGATAKADSRRLFPWPAMGMPMLAEGVSNGGFLPASVPMSRPMQSAALANPSQFSDAGLTGSGRPLNGAERRVIAEPYRQAFGRKRTEEFGRPAGWTLLMSAIEKVFFPTSLLIMVILQWWEELAVTVAAETAICVMALFIVMKGRRLDIRAQGSRDYADSLRASRRRPPDHGTLCHRSLADQRSEMAEMMINRLMLLGVFLLTAAVSDSRAQTPLPAAAVAAEAAGRWDEAIAGYEAVIAADPLRADLWVRNSRHRGGATRHARLDRRASARHESASRQRNDLLEAVAGVRHRWRTGRSARGD